MPLRYLNERPDRRAVLVDLTCDSDGKVSHYVSSNSDKRFLEVHDLVGRNVFGFFLMGAYQDMMRFAQPFAGVARLTYADAEARGLLH